MSSEDNEPRGAASRGQKDEPGRGNVYLPTSEIFKVGIRVPPFYPDDPDVWFAQLEAQFALANITNDTTKFYYVIGHIDQQYAKDVKDIMAKPPATQKYETLKSELISRLSASKTSKIKQLLHHEDLGDRKPSQFYRHLRNLAGPDFPDEYLQSIWVCRLPVNIQTVLAAHTSTPLEIQADVADRIAEVVLPSPQVNSATAIPVRDHSLANELAELRKEIFELRKEVNKRKSRSHSRQPSGNRSRSRSQSSYRKFPICFYHSKFGNKAHKCVRPCDFNSENFKGGR